MKFQSSKLFDGYSTVFRQWRATGTHCKFLHGYAISFRVWFEGELDERNWVWDFGGMKRAQTKIEGVEDAHGRKVMPLTPKEYFSWLLDHTVVVAEDDPFLEEFKKMDIQGIIQLRVLPATGCERFAEYLFNQIDQFLQIETDGRVSVAKVEVYEHDKNSASFSKESV